MRHLKLIVCSLLVTGFVALHAAENKNAVKPYPLKTCVVSGEKLDAMGSPYVFNHKGQEIKLCCKGCLKAFNKEPEKYLKKLATAPQGK